MVRSPWELGSYPDVRHEKVVTFGGYRGESLDAGPGIGYPAAELRSSWAASRLEMSEIPRLGRTVKDERRTMNGRCLFSGRTVRSIGITLFSAVARRVSLGVIGASLLITPAIRSAEVAEIACPKEHGNQSECARLSGEKCLRMKCQPVATVLCRQFQRRVSRTIQLAFPPLPGHRFSNGLLAPMTC